MYVSKRDRVQVVQAFSGCLTKGQFENRGSSSLLPCPLKYPLACIIICYIPDLTSKIGNFHVLGQVCSIKCYMLRGIICAWRKNRNEFRSPWSSWRNNDFPAAMAMLPYSECAFIWWSVAEESLLGNESGRTGKKSAGWYCQQWCYMPWRILMAWQKKDSRWIDGSLHKKRRSKTACKQWCNSVCHIL